MEEGGSDGDEAKEVGPWWLVVVWWLPLRVAGATLLVVVVVVVVVDDDDDAGRNVVPASRTEAERGCGE